MSTLRIDATGLSRVKYSPERQKYEWFPRELPEGEAKKKHNKAGLGAGLNYALTNTMNKHSTKVVAISV